MTDNTDKLMAEALVECGYALKQKKLSDGNYYIYLDMSNSGNYIREHPANPFADTLEGRKQADALEDYFEQRPDLWDLWNSYSRPYIYDVGESMREWRLDRTKYCFEQLAEKSHD